MNGRGPFDLRDAARGPCASRPARALALLTMLIGVACSTPGAPFEDLPDHPIAFLHWEDRDARKRGEAFENAAEIPAPVPDRATADADLALEIRAHLRAEQNSNLARTLAAHPGRIKLYWPRTGVLESLAAAPPGARPLAWSPDRRRLLFVSSHRDGSEQLYEYDLERRDLARITVGPDAYPRGAYDGDGNLVVQRWARDAPFAPGHQTLHRVGAAGVDGEIIAEGLDPGVLRITADGTRIVYERVEPHLRSDGPPRLDSVIATRRLAAGAQEQILSRGREPALSRDGNWIVFASRGTAGYRLRRMRLDGSARISLQPGGARATKGQERMPAISPDGRFVAFIREAGNTRRLAIRTYDGGKPRVVLSSGWSEFPVW